MYTAQIENADGNILTLTGNEANYQVISIVGLNPPNALINSTDIAGMDGAKFNSSKLETRNIVITLKINGNVETNRLYLYQFFRTKEKCTFYYKNSSRNVFINGYVETVECDLFSNSEVMQISIICMNPYFKNVKETVSDISNTIAAFEFPFAINIGEPIPFSTYEYNRETIIHNESSSKTGLTINIEVFTPFSQILIRNTVTGEYIKLSYSFLEGDIITINTNPGEKSLKLLRNGVETNIFSALQSGSTFLQLNSGDNSFGYLIDGGGYENYAFVIFSFYNTYRGV